MLNLLYIMVKDLVNFVFRIPKLFLIMIFSLLLSNFGMLFMFNLNEQMHLQRLQYDLSTKTYSLHLNSDIDKNLLYRAVKAIMIDRNLPEVLSVTYQMVSNRLNIIGYYRDEEFDDWQLYLRFGRDFTAEELNTSDDLAIVSDGVLAMYPALPIPPVGAQIRLLDIDFTIIGVTGMRSRLDLYLPYKTFEKYGFNPNTVHLIFSQRLTENQLNHLNETLRGFSTEVKVTVLDSINRAIQRLYYQGVAVVFFVILIAVANITSIFSYWLRLNRRQYLTYRICGATTMTITFLIIAELMLISTAMFLLAVVFYRILTPTLLQGVVGYLYSWNFILKTYLIYHGCILLSEIKKVIELINATSLVSQAQMEGYW